MLHKAKRAKQSSWLGLSHTSQLFDKYLFERFSSAPGTKCDLFWPDTADHWLGSDMLEGDSLVVSKNHKKQKKVALFHWEESGAGLVEDAALPAPTAAAALPTIVSSLGGSFCVHGTFIPPRNRAPPPVEPEAAATYWGQPSNRRPVPKTCPPFGGLVVAG